MVANLFKSAKSAAALCLLGASLAVSAPAMANSSAAAADVTAPLRDSQNGGQTALGTADADFRSLFRDWQALDHGGTASQRTTVSIPSRMPVDGSRMSSNFGTRRHPVLGGRRAHHGVDLAGPVGTPIYATADGVIAKADWFGGYGLFVQIEHGGSMQTRYGHMSRLNVAPEQRVRKGDVIGFMGSTGRSTGSHLHYEVRIDGVAVNPVPYMQADGIAAAAPAANLGLGGPE